MEKLNQEVQDYQLPTQQGILLCKKLSNKQSGSVILDLSDL